MQFNRYGIYYAPPSGSALAAFGASWLGWDVEAGAEVAHPSPQGLARPVADITMQPRKYGFHGTLKSPFRLAAGRTFEDLDAAAADLARHAAPFEGPPLQLSSLGSFLALKLSAPCPPLAALAAKCVRDLDGFRAPATEAELTKRRAGGLTSAQEENLSLWGYPYVLDEFRFHLTLTGPLGKEDQSEARQVLEELTAPLCSAPLPFNEICVFGEAPDGRFHLVRRHPFQG